MPIITAQAQYTPRGDLGQFITANVTPAIIAAVAASTARVVQEAQAIVPVDTGALQASIHAEGPDDTGRTVVGVVTADIHYAGYVEFGTGIRGAASPGAGPYPYSPTWPGMPAQPYLRPALDSVRSEVRANFESAISLGMRK